MIRVHAFAAPFNSANAYNETLLPGAFTDFLKYNKKKIPMYINHDESRRVGWWTHARQDSRGLFVDGIVEDPAAEAYVRAGGVRQVSIGALQPRTHRRKPTPMFIEKAALYEVSLVDRGAYNGTWLTWEPVRRIK